MVGTFHQYLDQLGHDLENYTAPYQRSRIHPAIKQMQDIGITSKSDLISAAISEENSLDVRWVACRLLLLINYEKGVSRLISIIENQNNPPELRIAATMVAGRSGTAKGVRRLANLVGKSGEPDVDLAIMYSLLNSVTDTAIHLFVSILQSNPHANMREMAAYCLGQAGSSLAVKPLTAVITNKSENILVRSKAAEALGMLSDPFAVNALIQIINDESPEIRFWAAYALGQIGDTRAIPALKSLIEDDAQVPDYGTVGSEAKNALRHFGD